MVRGHGTTCEKTDCPGIDVERSMVLLGGGLKLVTSSFLLLLVRHLLLVAWHLLLLASCY